MKAFFTTNRPPPRVAKMLVWEMEASKFVDGNDMRKLLIFTVRSLTLFFLLITPSRQEIITHVQIDRFEKIHENKISG